MAESELGSTPVEKGSKKRKNEEEDPPTTEKKNLSKFTLNCTFSLNTNDVRQEAVVLTQIPRKKHKKQKSSISKKEDDDSNSSDEDSNDELREPTAEELKEAEEPRNILSIITFRDKKRQSHKKNLEHKAEKDAQKNVQRITEYLQKWKNNRSEWKFEKLRQIYLVDVMFDEDKIDDELWPIALEYLGGSKGSAKEKIVQCAQDEIQKIDDEIERTGDNDLMNQVTYRRAREVLQTLG